MKGQSISFAATKNKKPDSTIEENRNHSQEKCTRSAPAKIGSPLNVSTYPKGVAVDTSEILLLLLVDSIIYAECRKKKKREYNT